MKIKPFIIATVTAVLALAGLSSCRVGDRLSQSDRDRLIARFERQLAKELDLTPAQREALDDSMEKAGNRLAAIPRPDREKIAAAREAFVAGGDRLDSAIEDLAAARESDPGQAARRKELRAGLRADFRPFLDSLSPEQRGELFDLAASRRAQ